MKNIFYGCFVLITLVNSAMAQKGLPGCSSVTTPSGNIVFYGIDYSLVRFSYISERADYTIRTMSEINRLFITEARKYDVAKLMGKNVVKTDLDYAQSEIDHLNVSEVVVSEDYRITVED